MKKSKWQRVKENADSNAHTIINELQKSKNNYSNVVIHAQPQTGKDALSQFLVKYAKDNLFEDDKPLLHFHILCDSNVQTKSQSTNRRLEKDSTIAQLYADNEDFICFVLHRNDLDGMFNFGPKTSNLKGFTDIGFKDETGAHLHRVQDIQLEELQREIKKGCNIVTTFDEFHQHIHQDRAIEKFHEFLGISPKEVSKNKPVFYVTATGSAFYAFLAHESDIKVHNYCMTEPEGYYGIEDYIDDSRFFDWEMFKPLISKGALGYYDKIFKWLQPKFKDKSYGFIVLRYFQPRGGNSQDFQNRVEEFCRNTDSKVEYVDMNNSKSAENFKASLRSKPSGGSWAQYSGAGQKIVYVLKQMFACGQSIETHNILWWIEPPLLKNNPTAIQRVCRVCGLDAEDSQVKIIGPKAEAELYINAHKELKNDNLVPMSELNNQLVNSKSKTDWGWVNKVVPLSSVTKIEGKAWHYLSGMAAKTTTRRGTVDVSEQLALAISVGETKTNQVNTNLVGGTRNVKYFDPITQKEYECFSIRLDGPNKNDWNDYWNEDLSQYQGQIFIAYRGRTKKQTKEDIQLNEKCMLKSYQENILN